MNGIVCIEWLNVNLNLTDLVILDASLITTANENSSKTPLKTIPGSRFFDLKNTFSDSSSPLPNTIPNEGHFEVECHTGFFNLLSKEVISKYKNVYQF